MTDYDLEYNELEMERRAWQRKREHEDFEAYMKTLPKKEKVVYGTKGKKLSASIVQGIEDGNKNWKGIGQETGSLNYSGFFSKKRREAYGERQ